MTGPFAIMEEMTLQRKEVNAPKVLVHSCFKHFETTLSLASFYYFDENFHILTNYSKEETSY